MVAVCYLVSLRVMTGFASAVKALQPSQRVRPAGYDRTENKPVLGDTVEDEMRECLQITSAKFRDDGGAEI